ncbi:MAG: phage tail protein [Jatrophihabitans sp.]
MTMSLEAILGLKTRFLVTVDGVSLGGWGKCSGLKVDFHPMTISEGGNYDYKPILPGNLEYTPITLVRAMNAADSMVVQSWLRERVGSWVHGIDSGHSLIGAATNLVSSALGGGSAAGGTAKITLCDPNNNPVLSWDLRNVYPSKWIGPDLDAMTMGIATETLELVHEGFL